MGVLVCAQDISEEMSVWQVYRHKLKLSTRNGTHHVLVHVLVHVPAYVLVHVLVHPHCKELVMSENETACPMCAKKKERSEKELKDMMNRLKRIEGQVRGVQNMLENDAYCLDIINQVSAINSALNSFNRLLLNKHLHSCVADGVRAGDDNVIDELDTLLQKMLK